MLLRYFIQQMEKIPYAWQHFFSCNLMISNGQKWTNFVHVKFLEYFQENKEAAKYHEKNRMFSI